MTGDEVTHRVEAPDQERLFLIAPAWHRASQADPAQPAKSWRPRFRPVDKPAVAAAESGWTLPPYVETPDHTAALIAHARRIRGGYVTSTVSLEEL